MIPITAADFEKQPRGPYRFDRWIAKQNLASPLGPFTIDFNMLGKGDENPPDDEMLRRASELAAYLESHGDYILDIVFGHYLFAAEQKEWLESCSVPRDLGRSAVTEFISTRSLTVSRHLNWEEPYRSGIFLIPRWEEEHAIRLEFRDGDIATLNDSRFTLESGALRWIRG